MKRRLCSLIEIGFVKCQFNFPPCYNSSLGALIDCGLCERRRCEGAHFIKLNRKRSKFIRVKQPEPKYCDFFMTGKNVLRYISWMGLTGVLYKVMSLRRLFWYYPRECVWQLKLFTWHLSLLLLSSSWWRQVVELQIFL